MSKLTGSKKATQFTESVIREMTRLNQLHGGVNLSQGFPGLSGAGGDQGGGVRRDQRRRQPVRGHVGRAAAARGDRARVHAALRRAGRRRRAGDRLLRLDRGDDGDDDGDHRSGRRGRHLRAVLRELRARRDPVRRDAALRHAARAATGTFDPDELAAAFNDKTKAIIINTPNNPTGKVFTREELETIAALCRKWDAIAISDEIYEHIIYDGHRHIPIATIDGMADRTVTINGLSKTYSVTGWRVGWTISPPSLTGAIRKVHDFLTVGAPAPLQEAGAVALGLPEQYYTRSRGRTTSGAATCCSTSSSAITSRATSRTARTTS